MRRLVHVIAFACAGWVAARGAAAQRAASPPPLAATLVLEHIDVVDVERSRVLRDRRVTVAGTRIVSVDSGQGRRPGGARVVDGRGKYLMPGLWDMHVHTTGPGSERLLPVYVAYGVTGIRDMGASLKQMLSRRGRIVAGAAVGPRIVTAGPILDGPLGVPMPAAHRSWRIEVVDTGRARAVVDSLAAGGADFIKVHERLSAPVYRAIVDQARRRGLGVAGHVPAAVGAAAAARSGQRSIEHLVNVPFPCSAVEVQTLRPRTRLEALFGRCDTQDPATLTRAFTQARTWHTPTLVVQQRVALGGEAGGDTGSDDPGMRYVPEGVVSMLREVGPFDGPALPPPARQRLRSFFTKRVAQTGALHRAKVRLLVGTDAPGVAPGWSVHEELRLFTAAGLSPAEALYAATRGPAEFLGADSLGRIAAGAGADMVVLDANPLADIRNTRKVRAVVANGRLFDRAALDALLATAHAQRKVMR